MADCDESTCVVRENETLYDIAARTGVDADTIWSYPKNAPLKDAGRTPSMLVALDVVYVPVPRNPVTFELQTGQDNNFVSPPADLFTVAVKLVDDDGNPLAGEAWEAPDLQQSDSTDGDGTLTIKDIPMDTDTVAVQLTASGRWLEIIVGGLDPVSTDTGRAQRLKHLGYLSSFLGEQFADIILDACALFAQDHAPDAQTQDDIDAALVKVHGS
jgi:hypothetical protein